jgi:ferric-dicitrate binding protein FerR (iron transport regulator)
MVHAELDPEAEDAFLDRLADLTAEAPGAPARQRARLAFLTAVGSEAPPPPPRVSRRRHALVLALAAAAIAAVTLLLPEREHWRARIDGAMLLDGRAFVPGDEARLAAELAGSGTLETALAPLRLTVGALDLELLPGTRLRVPVLPPLDGATTLDLELAHGELFLRTSARWSGNPIVVRTPVADVMLHGTTVGVLADELGTCVCVVDGTARVLSPNLAGFAREVGERSILRVHARRGVAPDAMPFPPDDAPEAEHTRPLEGFHGGP